ncbi:hypothetical protein OWM54_12270 [Myxococcus sp. MISCRS1]|uniref:hypothetical protein n=1 Tax=Myxococcus sp. MISCRS1 TaxID=2996786 RepID=UPI00227019AB|nr:hypothetical protein [Myxococcus sp. MISCRS1]MCY0997912.1 hypothetical protein [Myxococcus sp. MISCRS1]
MLKVLVTAWEFARGPGRFAQRWARGGWDEVMNPLAFVSVGATLVTFGTRALLTLTGEPPPRSLFSEFLMSLAPHLYYAQLGLVMHVVLRHFGSQRRWSSSVAMVLYAGGTFATLGMLLVHALGAVAWSLGVLVRGEKRFLVEQAPEWVGLSVVLLMMGPATLFLVFAMRALKALHAARGGPFALAVVLGLLSTGAVGRLVPLPTLQLVLKVVSVHDIPVPILYWRF